MANTVKSYMIPVYAALVKRQVRDIESLPEEYIVPVSEYLAAQNESGSTSGSPSDTSSASSNTTSEAPAKS